MSVLTLWLLPPYLSPPSSASLPIPPMAGFPTPPPTMEQRQSRTEEAATRGSLLPIIADVDLLLPRGLEATEWGNAIPRKHFYIHPSLPIPLIPSLLFASLSRFSVLSLSCSPRTVNL